MRTKDNRLQLPPGYHELARFDNGDHYCYLIRSYDGENGQWIDPMGHLMSVHEVAHAQGWNHQALQDHLNAALKADDDHRLRNAQAYALPADAAFIAKISNDFCVAKCKSTGETFVYTNKGVALKAYPFDPQRIPLLMDHNKQVSVMTTDKPNDQLTVLTTSAKVTIDAAGTRLDTRDGEFSLAGVIPAPYGHADVRALDHLVARDGSATVAINVPLTPPPAKQYTSENVTPEDLERIRQEWALPDIESARAFIKQRDLERERREALALADSKDIDANTAFMHRLKAIQLRQEQDKLAYGEILAETRALASWFKDVDPAELLKGMTTVAAVKHLCQELREDSSYAWGWHSNIAMAMRDSGCDALVAQKGAALFLQILTMDEEHKGLDITASEEYKGWMEQYHAGQNKPA